MQSPDGITGVSAGADETLRFWEVFGPPTVDNSRISDLDSFLSLKTSPLNGNRNNWFPHAWFCLFLLFTFNYCT